MSGFSLRKWYLDVADDGGNVYIGYCVSLKWRKLELSGYQHLWRAREKGVETQTAFSRQPVPGYEGESQLNWEPDGLKGTWESTCAPIRDILFDTADGKIEWCCMQPKARASVTSSGRSVSGWGYTEYIDITVPVWRLPFKTLYWGRCHTNDHYLVWIRWDGKTKQNFIWFDGTRSTDYVIEAERVAGPDFLLTLGDSESLRQGKVGSTIFRPFNTVLKALPRSTFMADERKWFSKGVLEIGSKAEPALVIYEEVRW